MSIFDEIALIVGPANISTDRIECLCNSRDMSVHQGVAEAIVYVKNTEQVSAIMKLAHRDKVPVTPRGSGTSTTGASLAGPRRDHARPAPDEPHPGDQQERLLRPGRARRDLHAAEHGPCQRGADVPAQPRKRDRRHHRRDGLHQRKRPQGGEIRDHQGLHQGAEGRSRGREHHRDRGHHAQDLPRVRSHAALLCGGRDAGGHHRDHLQAGAEARIRRPGHRGLRGRECGRRRGHRGDDLRASSSPAARSWTSSASRSWRRPWARM